MAELFAALIHHPVLDRNGRVVTSAITSLDIHDLARSARTYDIRRAYVVHPIAEQREFARTVIDHWRFDFGRSFDGRRREALETIAIVSDLDAAIDDATQIAGRRPLLAHTSAQTRGGTPLHELRSRMESRDGNPIMLMFGTGFGMAPAMQERADIRLDAIRGPGDFNHLSVRAAISIVFDRLRGR
ncbi:MAG TPA: RNA methyltransferase [Candidatus Binataceae bacterium]|nr:RNA methyltransferase [Candidatus Binataceae bacterium]